MVTNQPKIGQEPKPRFEFRTFGQDFEAAGKRMARLSIPVPEDFWERHSDEIYILSRFSNSNNVKIRNGKIEIKTLTQVVEDFEQWGVLLKEEFPLNVGVLTNYIFPALKAKRPGLNEQIYTAGDLVKIVHAHPELHAVRVHKQRFGYVVNNTICETGVVLINGAKVLTIASESSNLNDIKEAVQAIGLEGLENINYLQAIKRVVGMIDKSLANE